MSKVNTRKIAPNGYFSHNSIKKNIPPMRTTGLNIKKKDLPAITEDPFENEPSDNIGVNMIDERPSDTRLTDDVLGFTNDMDVDEKKGGRRRRKTRRRKSKKSKRRRRSRRR
jgi:hypothetical protein